MVTKANKKILKQITETSLIANASASEKFKYNVDGKVATRWQNSVWLSFPLMAHDQGCSLTLGTYLASPEGVLNSQGLEASSSLSAGLRLIPTQEVFFLQERK